MISKPVKSTPADARDTAGSPEPAPSVYLDYAATSPLLPVVRTRMSEVLEELTSGQLGNPSALHAAGQRSQRILEAARAEVASLIGARPEEIIFTSGATEANNTVIHTFAGQPIAVSAIEHPSVLEPARAYARPLTLIPVDEHGVLDTSQVDLSPCALISTMLVNNELGTLVDGDSGSLDEADGVHLRAFGARQDGSEMDGEEWPNLFSRECVLTSTHVASDPVTTGVTQRPERRWLGPSSHIHIDITQAVGKIPLSAQSLGADYLSFSAHKLGGPVGIGALYVRPGSPLRPLLLGGHQEEHRRAGTSNVLLAAGFAAACRHAQQHLSDWSRVRELRDHLAQQILATIPHAYLNTPITSPHTAPHILNVSFAGAEGEAIQLYLDAAGIIVSTGSACAAGDLAPSHVLMATHHDAERAHGSIRFSLGLQTTQRDLDRVMSILPGVISRLRSMSTVKLPTSPASLSPKPGGRHVGL